MINWHIEKRKISSLKKHTKNPRILTSQQAEHLKDSIEKFGIVDKPAINLDGTIIGGHQRLAILKKMGQKEIEVYVPDRQLEEKEVDELCIRLNRIHGEFDYDALANNFEVIDLLEWGFSENELDFSIDVLESDDNQEKCKKQKLCPNCGHEI